MTELTKLDGVVMVADVARALNDFLPLSQTLDAVCRQVAGLGGYSGASLLMPDAGAEALIIRGSWQLNDAYVEKVNNGRLLPLGERDAVATPTVEAYLTGNPVMIADVDRDSRFSWPRGRSHEYRSLACIPVIARAAVIGVLNCYGSESHEHTEDELDLLQVLARLAGVAIETARVAEEQRAAQNQLRELSERLGEQNRQLSTLTTIQTRFVEEVAAQPMASVVERIAATLAGVTRRAVLVSGANGEPIAFVGATEERSAMALAAAHRELAMHLRQKALVTIDGSSCARIGMAETELGTIVLRPALENDRDIPALATLHAAMVIAVALQAERANSSTAGDSATPAILLALAGGLYSKVHVPELLATLRVSADTTFRLVALRCPTRESAYRLSRRREALKAAGWPLIASTADGHDCLVLLESPSLNQLAAAAAATRERHSEVERIGVSGVASGLLETPSARIQAGAAAEVDAETTGSLTVFDDLGGYGWLLRDLPSGRAALLVQRVLGPIYEYDAHHGTHLIDTLIAYVGHSGRLQETAAALDVHPGTVRQRLHRTGQLAGFDLRDFKNLSEVVLALNLARMLGEPAASQG
jgi:GAF domain-containing protein